MCGRYVVTEDAGRWADRFGAEDELGAGQADYNVAPTVTVPAVLCVDGRRRLRRLRWGLVPSWAGDLGGPPLINARLETVAEKPSFRAAFAARRCLLPADGWYEWADTGAGARRPFHIAAADGRPVAFAGLYEVWHGPGRLGPPLWSVTIVTGPAPDDLAHLHDRAPVLVPPARRDAWLDPGLTDPDEVRGLLRPPPAGTLRAYPVSPRVNDARATGPGLLAPWQDPTPVQPTLF